MEVVSSWRKEATSYIDEIKGNEDAYEWVLQKITIYDTDGIKLYLSAHLNNQIYEIIKDDLISNHI